jgi:hypothetical protein
MLKIPWIAIAIEKNRYEIGQMKTKAHDLATHHVP